MKKTPWQVSKGITASQEDQAIKILKQRKRDLEFYQSQIKTLNVIVEDLEKEIQMLESKVGDVV